MAVSTFSITSFSVLSRWLLDSFVLTRWQLGLLVTAVATVGAITSPALGRLSDRIGGRRAVQLTFALSAVVLAGIALSPVYALLIVAALIAGLAQAVANPSTNKLIAVHAPTGGRGTITGIKQSGVQVGVLLGGSLLPLGATTIGWRAAVAIAAAVPVVGLLATSVAVPPDRPDPPRETTDLPWSPLRSPFLVRLAVYGFLVGAGWSAVFTYLPDYAQTALGWQPTVSGLLVSTAGLFGVAGRIGWSSVAERRLGSPATLMTLAGIGTLAVVGALAAPGLPGLLWLAAAAFGASSGAWNAVGMFAIVDRLPARASGAGSGVVMFGFLIGLGLGAPPFGWSVDVSGTYAYGLLGVVGLHVAALVTAWTLRHSPITAVGRPAP
jgi:predicted MFS family arabinose efflux permease